MTPFSRSPHPGASALQENLTLHQTIKSDSLVALPVVTKNRNCLQMFSPSWAHFIPLVQKVVLSLRTRPMVPAADLNPQRRSMPPVQVKKIIVGRGGVVISTIGKAARLDLQAMYRRPVHIILTVRVDKK